MKDDGVEVMRGGEQITAEAFSAPPPAPVYMTRPESGVVLLGGYRYDLCRVARLYAERGVEHVPGGAGQCGTGS